MRNQRCEMGSLWSRPGRQALARRTRCLGCLTAPRCARVWCDDIAVAFGAGRCEKMAVAQRFSPPVHPTMSSEWPVCDTCLAHVWSPVFLPPLRSKSRAAASPKERLWRSSTVLGSVPHQEVNRHTRLAEGRTPARRRRVPFAPPPGTGPSVRLQGESASPLTYR